MDGIPYRQYDRRKPVQKGDLHLAGEQDLVGRHATWMEESASRDGEEDAAVREGIARLLELEYRNGLDRGSDSEASASPGLHLGYRIC